MAKRLPSQPPLLAGYTYIRPLGSGGFADVFLFEQNTPRRLVAVKVLLQDAAPVSVRRMFNAEADVLAKLSSHPSIVTVFEASVSSDGRPYLVMEYCPTSFATRYRTEQIPVAEVLTTGVKIASALETAHRSRLLHRDVKPSNILVNTYRVPLLSDFGIASSFSGSTSSDAFAMSVPWSAPEVVAESVSGSVGSEVWSLGATVYSLLAGRSPFEVPGPGKNSREQLTTRIRRAKYTPLVRPDVPASLNQVLAKAMHRDPVHRHRSALEFAEDLRSVQAQLGLQSTLVEVAVDEWTVAGAPIDFENQDARGPVRASVQYDSPRAARRAAQQERARSLTGQSPTGDSTVMRSGGESGRSVPLKLVVWGGIAAVAVVVVAVIVITGML